MALQTKFYDPITPLNNARITQASVDQVHLAAIYAVVVGKPTPPSADRWLMFFDRTIPPVLGDFPRLRFSQPPEGIDLIVEFQQPIQFISGLWWATSATPATFTPVGLGEQIVILQAHYA